jgi:hypothetical protein
LTKVVDRARGVLPPELLRGLVDEIVRADVTMLHRQGRAWSELGLGEGATMSIQPLTVQEVRIACAYRTVSWWLRLRRAIRGGAPAILNHYELCGRGSPGAIAVDIVVRRGAEVTSLTVR